MSKAGLTEAPGTVQFSYDGQPLVARDGDSIAAAVVAAGAGGFRHDGRGGRRGVFCGMGVCTECAVTVDGEAGHLACLEKCRQGACVEGSPAVRPLGWAGHSQRTVRPGSARGPGSIKPRSLAARPTATGIQVEKRHMFELVIVGAGPGGLSAALAARRAGVDVLVVDERPVLGGQYFKQPASALVEQPGLLDAQYQRGRELLTALADAGVPVLAGARAWGLRRTGEHFEAFVTPVDGALGAVPSHVLAQAVVLAAGAYERGVPFPGWTLPGVMQTGAAQTLLRSYLVVPGQRVLVSGNGPLNIQVAAELAEAGVEVVAVAELARLARAANLSPLLRMGVAAPALLAEGGRYVQVLLRHHVPLLFGACVVAVRGERRAELGVVARVDGRGRPVHGSQRSFRVDAVLTGFGFVPSADLARTLGCVTRWDHPTGTVVIERDQYGRTSVDRAWVVGDGGAVEGAHVAQAMGVLAGVDAARALGRAVGGHLAADERRAQWRLRRARQFQRALWQLYAAPVLTDQLADNETLICRCEGVTLGDIQAALVPWSASVGALKRRTRAGMGKCQGRYCGLLLGALVANESGVQPDGRAGFAPQLPHLPVRLRAIASEAP